MMQLNQKFFLTSGGTVRQRFVRAVDLNEHDPVWRGHLKWRGHIALPHHSGVSDLRVTFTVLGVRRTASEINSY